MKKLLFIFVLTVLLVAAGSVFVQVRQQKAATNPSEPQPQPESTVGEQPVPPLAQPQSPASGNPPAVRREPSRMSDWDRKLEAVLTQNEKHPKQAVLLLLNMLPTLKEEEQAEAADHAVNLLEDEEYASVLPQLINPRMQEEVIDIFYTDLLNRPDEVKLPALLEVAKQPAHPYAEEARETLSLFIGEDHEQNWAQWKSAVDQYLQNGEKP